MSEFNQCNCHSYNGATGDAPEVVLTPPAGIGMTRADGGVKDEVCVDACIAHVISYLWDHGIVTQGSCCGHGKRLPSIVLLDHLDAVEGLSIRRLISNVDKREFELISWGPRRI